MQNSIASLFDIEVPHVKIKKYYLVYRWDGNIKGMPDTIEYNDGCTSTAIIDKPKWNLLIQEELIKFLDDLKAQIEKENNVNVKFLAILNMMPLIA